MIVFLMKTESESAASGSFLLKKIIKKKMESVAKIISIAVGGALGAVARYLLNLSPLASVCAKFPLPTFLINTGGSFLIGFLFVLLTEKLSAGENLRLGLIVGFLGAFTTFSTFELELFDLAREREFAVALGYLSASVLLGLLGVASGIWLAKKF